MDTRIRNHCGPPPMTSPIPWAPWGPQFAFRPLVSAPPVDAGWTSLATLPGDAEMLAARVQQTADALDAMSGGSAVPDRRVAASLAQMSLVGRVVAVSVGLAVHGFDAADLLRGRAWWRPEPGVGFPLALPGPGTASGPVTLRGSWVEQLTDAMVRMFGVSTHVVWGNVASTVQATLRTVARVSPEHGVAAASVGAALLDHPAVAPADRVVGTGSFRRSSCCLLYRASPDRRPACGDCVLGARG